MGTLTFITGTFPFEQEFVTCTLTDLECKNPIFYSIQRWTVTNFTTVERQISYFLLHNNSVKVLELKVVTLVGMHFGWKIKSV